MDDQKKPPAKIIEAATSIIEIYRDLVTVNLVQHASMGISVSILGVIYLVFTILVLLFTGLGAAWWVGESLDNMKAGFFIVGSSYCLLFAVLAITARKFLIPQLRNLIIKKIYDHDN